MKKILVHIAKLSHEVNINALLDTGKSGRVVDLAMPSQ